jgi:hypothetical protein
VALLRTATGPRAREAGQQAYRKTAIRDRVVVGRWELAVSALVVAVGRGELGSKMRHACPAALRDACRAVSEDAGVDTDDLHVLTQRAHPSPGRRRLARSATI